MAGVPVEPDIASSGITAGRCSTRTPSLIGSLQSGETRDTIQAMQLARELGARTVAITNQMGSQIRAEVDSVLYTRTGLEVGVAASKTFSAQVGLMYLIGLEVARDAEDAAGRRDRVHPRRGVPAAGEDAEVPRRRSPIDEIAKRFYREPFFLSSAGTSGCRSRSRVRSS